MSKQIEFPKLVLFGAGEVGKRALHQLSKENVLAFCDNHKAGQTVEGIPVIDLSMLKESYKCSKVIVCVAEPYVACEIAEQLKGNGITCELCEECKELWKWEMMHIVDGEVEYLSEAVCSQVRRDMWYPLYQQMLDKYQEVFMDKKIDFWIHLGDKAETAYWAVKLGVVNADTIFAFSTKDEFNDVVIPVPDYTYHKLLGWVKSDQCNSESYEISGYEYEKCIEECKNHSKYPWKWERAFWIGNLGNHSSRDQLYKLGEKHPDELEIKAYDWGTKNGFIAMPEWYQYKYLIDARGYGGWTDRLKILFFLGRPIFVSHRPHKEFWMMYGLKAGKHYISINGDFSDLLEKKRELDSNPEKYKQITDAMSSYAEKFLTKDFAMEYLRDVILKYGTN